MPRKRLFTFIFFLLILGVFFWYLFTEGTPNSPRRYWYIVVGIFIAFAVIQIAFQNKTNPLITITKLSKERNWQGAVEYAHSIDIEKLTGKYRWLFKNHLMAALYFTGETEESEMIYLELKESTHNNRHLENIIRDWSRLFERSKESG